MSSTVISPNNGANAAATRVSNQAMPKLGQSKTLPFIYDPANAATFGLDLTIPVSKGNIDQVQSVYIDNADSALPFSLEVSGTLQRVTVPAGFQGWYPLLAGFPQIFAFTGATDPVRLYFCNVPMPAASWSAVGNNTGSPIAPIVSTELEGAKLLVTGQSILFDIYVTPTGTAGYLMLFDSAVIPANGAVTPVSCIAVPADRTVGISFNGGPGEYFVNGIVAAFSTTGPFTLTQSATAFFHARAR